MARSQQTKRSISPQGGSNKTTTANKRQRRSAAVAIGMPIKSDPDGNSQTISSSSNRRTSSSSSSSSSAIIDRQKREQEQLKKQFMALFNEAEFIGGISNQSLKERFGNDKYTKLVPIINEFSKTNRLHMSTIGDELFYTLVDEKEAEKFIGLDQSAKLVYQVIEKSNNMGIWVKDIRSQTNIQQTTLNKIIKSLETRKLIKRVNSITGNRKKLYMVYNIQPSREITGGPWYTELEFDYEFISHLRKVVVHYIKRLNNGAGITLQIIKNQLDKAAISKVVLSLDDVKQLVQTLIYDKVIEEKNNSNNHFLHTGYDNNNNDNGYAGFGGGEDDDEEETLYVASRRITTMSDFKWWNGIIDNDFHFRNIVFEDGIVLKPHEPHHHT